MIIIIIKYINIQIQITIIIPNMSFKITHIQLTIIITITLFLLIPHSQSYKFPSQCLTTQYYNYLKYSCLSCPNNTIPSTLDNSYCNCSTSYYKNPNSIGFLSWASSVQPSCKPLAAGTTLGSNQVALVYDKSGALQSTVNKITCDTSSYPNTDHTQCIPCGLNFKYDTTLKLCICSSPNFYPVNGICTDGTSFTNPYSSNTQNNLLYGMSYLGCTATNIYNKQPCQILLNKCSQNSYTGSFCSLLNTKLSSFQQYIASNTDTQISLNIYASSVIGTNTSSVKNTLQFIVMEYNQFGKLLDIKPFDKQLLTCLISDEDVIKFMSFGLNLNKICLSSQIQYNTNKYYDIYALNSDRKYVQVYTIYSSSSYYKRYYSNGYTSTNIQYTSVPPLLVPYITLSQTDKPTISTTSTTSSINLTLLAPFIVFNVFIGIIFIINFYKYTKYNPDQNNDPYFFFKVLFIFFLMIIKHWGIGMWIWLFGVSCYCFCFYKFQQTVYLLLPSVQTQWWDYYQPFMIVFYIQFAFVLFSVGLLIYDLANTTDYFMIDWEKQKNQSKYDIHLGNNKRSISVWRKVLLVNQLYQLTTSQAVNINFTILFSIFFLDGLKWINLSYQIPNITNLSQDSISTNTKNVVLAYFIITFIIFIIAIIQYIIRYIIKTWNPLPYQDFIDLCCIANISLVIFDHPLHGYYIHGMNPLGKAEGSLNYIQSIFQKQARSYGKSRAFKNDDPDQIQTFQVIFPQQIRAAFQMKYKNRYLQKLVGRAYDTSFFAKPVPQMLDQNDYKQLQNIQNDMLESFKYYLQGVKTSQFNIRQRPFYQRLTQWPMDMDYLKGLPIFFKDHWHQFTQVLLSGHQIFLLINLINFVNILYIGTGSVTIACLISMVICKIVIKNLAEFLLKRNVSRNTLIDDRFFK